MASLGAICATVVVVSVERSLWGSTSPAVVEDKDLVKVLIATASTTLRSRTDDWGDHLSNLPTHVRGRSHISPLEPDRVAGLGRSLHPDRRRPRELSEHSIG